MVLYGCRLIIWDIGVVIVIESLSDATNYQYEQYQHYEWSRFGEMVDKEASSDEEVRKNRTGSSLFERYDVILLTSFRQLHKDKEKNSGKRVINVFYKKLVYKKLVLSSPKILRNSCTMSEKY